jgi:hypothetical protein
MTGVDQYRIQLCALLNKVTKLPTLHKAGVSFDQLTSCQHLKDSDPCCSCGGLLPAFSFQELFNARAHFCCNLLCV